MSEALLQSVLLGTARRPPEPPADGDPLAALAAAEASAEARLLAQAGAARLRALAGARPPRLAELPEPAPPESRPLCPPRAAGHLRQILRGLPDAVLEEWLDALAASGRVVPHEHLPALLDRCSDQGLSPKVESVLSERARWLAVHDPAWSWARGGSPAERWEGGSLADRRLLMRVLRATDPELARKLLGSDWAQAPAREREALLGELATGLAPADEPFLEAALDDRAPSVRAEAARLLSGLPGSALAQRMAARLRPLISSSRKELRVALPDPGLTDEMRRDGMTAKPPTRMGASTWVLWQLAAAAPLRIWTEAVDARPEKVAGRRVADAMGDTLREAWVEAALRQRDGGWAAALLDGEPADARRTHALLRIAGPEAAERFVARALKASGSAWWLSELPGPWSERFSRAVLDGWLESDHPHAWIGELGSRGAPAVAGRLASRVEKLDPGTAAARHGAEALALLTFRTQMLDAF